MEFLWIVLAKFQALTFGQWLLGTVLVMSGRRENLRQERAMRRARIRGWRPYEHISCWSNWAWGWALVLVGLGLLWDPFARAGWVVAGVSRFFILPGPCEMALFNRPGFWRSVRNLFTFLLGALCCAYGLLPLLERCR